MKSILAALALITATNANAVVRPGFDEIYTATTCRPAVQLPDVGIQVNVQHGGIAGIPRIQVLKSFLGHSFNKTFFVSLTSSNPTVYQSADGKVRLTVVSTAETELTGLTAGTLEIAGEGTEQLKCEDIFYAM